MTTSFIFKHVCTKLHESSLYSTHLNSWEDLPVFSWAMRQVWRRSAGRCVVPVHPCETPWRLCEDGHSLWCPEDCKIDGNIELFIHAKFLGRNTNMYLHFISFLHIDMTHVVEILAHVTQGHKCDHINGFNVNNDISKTVVVQIQ